MNRISTLAALALVGAASLTVAACDSGSKPAAPAQTQQPTQPSKPGVPELTAAQKASIEQVFTEARVWAEEAHQHLVAGREAMRAGGMPDAVPHFQKAIPLFRKASQHVEVWIEPELGKITEEQRDAFLGPELHELSKWQKEMASMGKVPPKE